MFQKIKMWFKRNRKIVIITGTIVSVIGGIALILLSNGKEVEMPVDELADHLVPDTPDDNTTAAANISDAVSSAVSAAVAEDIFTVEEDGIIKTYTRSEFIRHLHEGWHPSPEKISQAAEIGIDLKDNETLVNSCTVRMKSAG